MTKGKVPRSGQEKEALNAVEAKRQKLRAMLLARPHTVPQAPLAGGESNTALAVLGQPVRACLC